MLPSNPERARKSRIGLLPLIVAALFASGCGRMGGGLSVQGPGFNVQVPPLGYSGSAMPNYGGQMGPNGQYGDPRYGYTGQQVGQNGQYVDPRYGYTGQQVGQNGQYVDPNQLYAQQQQGVYPNGQYTDPNQLAAQQQAYYAAQQQNPYAYNASAPQTTAAAGAQPTGGVPGSGLVASPFAPGNTQPLAGNVQAQFG